MTDEISFFDCEYTQAFTRTKDLVTSTGDFHFMTQERLKNTTFVSPSYILKEDEFGK